MSEIQMTNHFQTVIRIEQSTWCHVPEDWGLYVNTVSFSPL